MEEKMMSLNLKIEELRQVLNEMSCCLTSGNQNNKVELLQVSQRLDVLITEFIELKSIQE